MKAAITKIAWSKLYNFEFLINELKIFLTLESILNGNKPRNWVSSSTGFSLTPWQHTRISTISLRAFTVFSFSSFCWWDSSSKAVNSSTLKREQQYLQTKIFWLAQFYLVASKSGSLSLKAQDENENPAHTFMHLEIPAEPPFLKWGI